MNPYTDPILSRQGFLRPVMVAAYNPRDMFQLPEVRLAMADEPHVLVHPWMLHLYHEARAGLVELLSEAISTFYLADEALFEDAKSVVVRTSKDLRRYERNYRAVLSPGVPIPEVWQEARPSDAHFYIAVDDGVPA